MYIYMFICINICIYIYTYVYIYIYIYVYVCVLILKAFNHGLPLLYILCGCRDGRGEFQTSFHGKIDGFPGSQEDDLHMIYK